MAYDATKMKDWQIAEAAEENMPTPDEWREQTGLQKDEIIHLRETVQARLPEDHRAPQAEAGRQIC